MKYLLLALLVSFQAHAIPLGGMCHWCICHSVEKKILGCTGCNSGTPRELKEVKVSGSGNLLVAECPRPGEKSDVEWERKNGFSLRP